MLVFFLYENSLAFVCVSISILWKFRIICQVKKICLEFCIELGFPYSSVGKASACIVGDLGSIPGSGSFPGEGNGNPLQYSCLENRMDRGAWQATVHGISRVGHDLVLSFFLRGN